MLLVGFIPGFVYIKEISANVLSIKEEEEELRDDLGRQVTEILREMSVGVNMSW